MRAILGLILAAAPPAAIFLAQTWLMATGHAEAVLALAKDAGLLALLFFIFDGNSGLVPALMRLRHHDSTIRSAYRAYRIIVAACFAILLPLSWQLSPDETATMLPFCMLALLLRLPFLDADLDRRRQQHWSMLLQNLWMLPLALASVIFAGADAALAGHCALWSSLVYAAIHYRLRPRMKQSPPHSLRGPLREIFSFMAANGIGQLYGRGVLFVLGAAFTGPFASLVVYAKQLFNASGLVVAYLRRVELQRSSGALSMRLSLAGQAAVTVIGSVFLTFAALRLNLPHGVLAAVIAWQVSEKLSSTAIYGFQALTRHDLALTSLLAVVALGTAGLVIAMPIDNPLAYLTGETFAFGLVLALWIFTQRHPLNRDATS